MDTILNRELAGKEITRTECPQSPRGKTDWTMMHLSNGEIAMVSPDTHGQIPRWVRTYLAQQMKNFSIRRAGGTTYQWAGWMVRPECESATVFYSGYSGHFPTFARVARTLGMNLMVFEGYTRFNHDEKQRAGNQAALAELQKMVRRTEKGARIWDVASEEQIKANDIEWMKRWGG